MSKYQVTLSGADANGNFQENIWGTRYDVEGGTLHIIHARNTPDGIVGVFVKSYAPGYWLTVDEIAESGERLAFVGKVVPPPEEAAVDTPAADTVN